MCKFITGGNFIWIGGGASVFSLAAIAFERYLTVDRPRGELLERRNSRRLTAAIMGSWIYSLVFFYVTSVVLVGLNSATNPFIYTLCSSNFRRNIRGALSFGKSTPPFMLYEK